MGAAAAVPVNSLVDDVTSITISETPDNSSEWTFQLFKLCVTKPTRINTVATTFRPGEHFSTFEGEIWIPGTKYDEIWTPGNKHDQIWAPGSKTYQSGGKKAVIKIYSTKGEYKRTLELPERLKKPHALVPLKLNGEFHDQVAVVTNKLGAFTISGDGQIIQTLNEGKFADACVYKERIYAIEYIDDVVHVFNFTNSQWKLERKITTQSKPVPELKMHDTLQIYNNDLYVYVYGLNILKKISLEGENASEKISDERDEEDQVKNGRICGWDKTGILLFCDMGNKRLQVYNSQDKQWWSATLVKDLDFQPMYAVGLDENSFCVMDDENKLHFYNFD